jgi:hypothetical protein
MLRLDVKGFDVCLSGFCELHQADNNVLDLAHGAGITVARQDNAQPHLVLERRRFLECSSGINFENRWKPKHRVPLPPRRGHGVLGIGFINRAQVEQTLVIAGIGLATRKPRVSPNRSKWQTWSV